MRSSKEAENDKCKDNLFYSYNINIKYYLQKILMFYSMYMLTVGLLAGDHKKGL